MNRIERVKLFVNGNEKSNEVAEKVKEALIRNQMEIVEENFDLGIAIGGDGTFLRMIKKANFTKEAFFVGINSGTLGFAQDIHVDEVDSFIDSLKTGEFSFEEIGFGKGQVITKEKTEDFSFLNEVAIREKDLNVLGLKVEIDHVLLEDFVGDGLLISTPFGSTAYNLSYGGSIIYNTFHTLQITPIAPINNKVYHSLKNSVIIPSTKTIYLEPTERNHLILMVDGDNTIYQDVEKIVISMHQESIKVIRKPDYNFIQKVNDKFLK